MVVYYINKTSDRLTDYRYPIKEGDVCMLYDGEVVKTLYIDSEIDMDSILRDFKFIDTKSLKGYQFPKSDSILCAPFGSKHAIGDTALLTQLIKECKGEWLLDFLNETSSVLSGFVDYWELEVLRRLTGDDDIRISFESKEVISEFVSSRNEEDEVDSDGNEDVYDDDELILPKSYDIKWFCLSALDCLEGLIDERNYQILHDTLKGDLRSDIAPRYHLTQERIRQIVVKTTKQAKELLVEQRKAIEETKAENTKLKVQVNLLREDIAGLKKLLPKDVFLVKSDEHDIDEELTELLETPLMDMNLSVRATNILLSMGVNKFADIPKIESDLTLLKVRNSGRKTVREVTRLLEDFHLSFGMSYTEVVNALTENDWHDGKKKWMGDHEDEKNINAKTEAETKKNLQMVNKDVPSEEATIVLTRDIIEAARTPNGGFTKSQLAAIGIDWPPPEYWIQERVGTMITPSQLEEFNRIEYVAKPSLAAFQSANTKTYKDVAFNSDDHRKMEAILQAMTHFYTPATPFDIARSISRSAWGDDTIREGTVDSILKRLPEVEYVKWGKYILKSRLHM